MAVTPPDPITPPPADPPQGGTEKLKTLIQQVVGETLGSLFESGKADVAVGGSGRGRAGQGSDVDIEGQVKRAVAASKEEDKRTASEQARDAKIAELEAKLSGTEQEPKQYRRITKAIWGED